MDPSNCLVGSFWTHQVQVFLGWLLHALCHTRVRATSSRRTDTLCLPMVLISSSSI